MDLDAPVTELKGIGEKTAAILQKSGIKTIRDFFYNLPRTYENFQTPVRIADLEPGNVVIKGKIDSLVTRRTRRRNFVITEGVIRDNSGAIRVVWFNQPYRVKQFISGQEYYFTGLFDLKNGRYQLTSPSAALATEIDHIAPIKPIYVAHSSIKSHDFERLVNNSRSKFAEIPDLLPSVATGTRKNSLFAIHFPHSEKEAKDGRTYLAYEELFEFILAAKLNQQENQKLKSQKIPFEAPVIKQFVDKLPFKLTNAQRLATWEIFQDLERPIPMNRLLQGDVGSGKTMVAALAAYAAATHHVQTAFLAPTAVLANQHYEKLKKQLEPFGIKVALLTGATKNKPTLKSAIKQGGIDLVIGTHAILTDDTEFNNLGLAIIDEQHRFGVHERAKLLLKSPKETAPHLLTMTATPIPRSLQLTVFGDLDVSILNELPKGRQPITTKILTEVEQKESLYPAISEALEKRNQVYWICPLVEDSIGGNSSKTSVISKAKHLQKIFPNARIAYLHGRMKPAEKDDIMTRFASHEIDILVSTTVVEVGVDVPNATLIAIENAEGYGLAGLHQLRGRVGRGKDASFCYLIISGDNTPTRRLRELEKSNDGFHLAEVDLELRGPGEIYGALQHGALDLRIASFSDTRLIARARHDVEIFLQNQENMLKYKELMQNIKKYQQLTTLN